MREAVTAEHGLALADVVLVRTGKIPRTSSGKVERAECRTRLLAGVFQPVGAEQPAEETRQPDWAGVVPVELAELVADALETDPSALVVDTPLVRQRLDSLRAVRLRSALLETRGVSVPLPRFLDGLTLRDLAAFQPGEPVRRRPRRRTRIRRPSPPTRNACGCSTRWARATPTTWPADCGCTARSTGTSWSAASPVSSTKSRSCARCS